MDYWFEVMKKISDQKYPEQIAYLRENHGFSQAHANALVLYSRGSLSSRRFTTFEEYLVLVEEPMRTTLINIFRAVTDWNKDLKIVIAWNQPFVALDGQYLFSAAALKAHILIAPWSAEVLEEFRPRLMEYTVNKKTIKIPADWKVDKKLLRDMITAQRAELGYI